MVNDFASNVSPNAASTSAHNAAPNASASEAANVFSNASPNTQPKQTHTQSAYRGRMPLSQRAKIFVPFDPLRGFQEALREQERLAEERFREQDFSSPSDSNDI